MTTTIQHPTLGQIRGKVVGDVTQFLGVKYASLKDRFAEAEMVTGSLSDGVFDATTHGPHPPTLPIGLEIELKAIQHSLPIPDPAPSMSDTECLNVNITLPSNAAASARKLPVIAYIHGGAFIFGGNWFPAYDFKRLVKLGKDAGKPFIGVNIGYRLGITGMLASSELRAAGYKPNNGLRDQAVALQWLREHIGGFGGDAENVTVMGESAGSMSILHHLHNPLPTPGVPLFRRAIAMSGTPLLSKPLSPVRAEIAYVNLVSELGLSNLSATERVEKLKTMPLEQLLAKTPLGLSLIPVTDKESCNAPANLNELNALAPPEKPWCQELLIGHCKADASVFAFMNPRFSDPGLAASFASSITNSLSATPELATRLLAAYAITPDLAPGDAAKRIVRLASDAVFAVPARAYASAGLAQEVHAYAFEVGNPWPGMFEGESSHILDAALLFQNLADEMGSEEKKRVGERFALEVLGFAHAGGVAWGAWERQGDGVFGGEVRVYGDGVERVRSGRQVSKLRGEGDGEEEMDGLERVVGGDVGAVDRIFEAWEGFLAGR